MFSSISWLEFASFIIYIMEGGSNEFIPYLYIYIPTRNRQDGLHCFCRFALLPSLSRYNSGYEKLFVVRFGVLNELFDRISHTEKTGDFPADCPCFKSARYFTYIRCSL